LVESLTPDISRLIHRLMTEGDFLLLPMAIATGEETAACMEGEWPNVVVVASAEALHDVLVLGPFAWWQRN
jgi:hypothetical protein